MTPTESRPAQLKEIAPDLIKRNDDNPRLFFREEEMDLLIRSIKRYGIQVPITVYQEGSHFVLIDGERRWRSARKLNLRRIPAIVQPKPSPLENLLLMFNIHALREQWDYFTIANKLPDVQRRYTREHGKEASEAELSEATGLTRGQIRRCMLLLDLPQKYRDALVQELSLPKRMQKLSEDLFIEMERALKTVQNRVPGAVKDLDKVRDSLIGKFRKGSIKNVTELRMLSKMATAVDNLGIKETKAKESLSEIFDAHNSIGIEEVYEERFGLKYDERKVTLSLEAIINYLENIAISEGELESGNPLRKPLKALKRLIDRVLGD